MIITPAHLPGSVPGGLDYWYATEQRIKTENYRDRRAAREVNADNILTDCLPFGSLPRVAA